MKKYGLSKNILHKGIWSRKMLQRCHLECNCHFLAGNWNPQIKADRHTYTHTDIPSGIVAQLIMQNARWAKRLNRSSRFVAFGVLLWADWTDIGVLNWCSSSLVFPVEKFGDGFVFPYVETTYDKVGFKRCRLWTTEVSNQQLLEPLSHRRRNHVGEPPTPPPDPWSIKVSATNSITKVKVRLIRGGIWYSPLAVYL